MKNTDLKVNIYNCYHCNTGFDDKQILSEHIQIEHALKITFKSEKSVNEKPPEITHKCLKCSRNYKNLKIFKTHQKKCCGKPQKPTKFSCEICGLAGIYAKSIIEHCVKEHQMDQKLIKPYMCEQCLMRFSTSANLTQHKKYHKGTRSHICSFCGKTYITKSDLTFHEYTHFNRRNYKCELCLKAFNTNQNLRSHKLVVHTKPDVWKYGCDICNRRFPLKSGFEQHVKRHNGDKKFMCQVCNKHFVSRSELQKHLGYHSTVKAFKCEYCEKGYKEKRVYDVHLAKVHGIGDAKVPVRVKKFTCDVCPSAFFDKQKLARHLCTHSGEKPYGCVKCERKFSDKYYLKQHLKNVHKVAEREEEPPFE